jgi:hypothetical protein
MVTAPGRSRTTSPVAVTDVGRAVAFLAAQPAAAFTRTGRLFFIVDDEPITFHEINELAAQALRLPVRYRAVPAPLMRLFAGPIGYEYLATDASYSNARLTSLGFALTYPTAREGLPTLLRESTARTPTLNPGDPPMNVFTESEQSYLDSQPLGRLATVGPDGAPQTCPVGYTYNRDLNTIEILTATRSAPALPPTSSASTPCASWPGD